MIKWLAPHHPMKRNAGELPFAQQMLTLPTFTFIIIIITV